MKYCYLDCWKYIYGNNFVSVVLSLRFWTRALAAGYCFTKALTQNKLTHTSSSYWIERLFYIFSIEAAVSYWDPKKLVLVLCTCFRWKVQQIFICVVFVITALWATRQTEDVKGDRELHVKTTLRELIIYIVFLVILCISK